MNQPTTPESLVRDAQNLFLRGFCFAAIISVFLNLMMIVGPIFMIEVYGRVIPAKSYDTLYGLSIIAAASVLLYGILDYVRSWTYQVIAQGFAQRLNLPALQAGVLKAVEGGAREGVTVIRDIADLRYFIASNAVSLPIDAVLSLLFVAVLYMLHPVYALMALGLIALMIVLNVVTDRLTKEAINKANEAQAHHVAEVGSSLRHAEAIEAMGMLPALVRTWRVSHTEMLELANTAQMRARMIVAISRSMTKSIQMITVATGAVLVLDNKIAAGSLFAGMVLTSQAISPFTSLIETWRQWVGAAASWKRIRTLVSESKSLRQTMPAPVGDGDLLVERLIYLPEGRDIPVLRNVSFVVRPGEVMGIVGPSGAGKSTLARALVGVIRPTAGGVYLDGNSTYLWERGSFGRAVGYLPQSLSILDGTVRQTISRMEVSDPRLVIEAARQADIHELIGRLPFGYDTPISETTHLLSGGQMQRLGLARALYGNPQLLILDEPNSNLDSVGERALIDAVRAAKARGAIVVMIAHRPSVMACADIMLVLNEGQVIQQGPRTEVIDMISPEGRVPASKARRSDEPALSSRGEQK